MRASVSNQFCFSAGIAGRWLYQNKFAPVYTIC
jgi:hypothetical protein